MKNLRLDRPLVCFDLETTGTDPASDRIVQIGLIRLEPGSGHQAFESLVDPQRPIPPAATAVHGITDADVRGQPTLRDLLPRLEAHFAGADLAGFNSSRFDLPLLLVELERAGSTLDLRRRRHLDAMTIFHRKEPRDLTAALRFYCDKELADAHSALADATATLEVLDAQLARYGDLPRDVDGLNRFCNRDRELWVDVTGKFKWNADGEAVFAFGKHRDVPVREVARSKPDYLDWIIGSNFTPEVKRIARDALAGRFPSQPGQGKQ